MMLGLSVNKLTTASLTSIFHLKLYNGIPNLHTISLKNTQRLIFNLHLNTSNNLLLYKHIVLMTMTFDPTGPGSRMKVLELW